MRDTLQVKRKRRGGAALVYMILTMVGMIAFCSLSVDLGRYETAHSQLYNAALAASRAGAGNMTSASAASAAAIAVATSNSVDGQPIAASAVTVQYINWTSSSDYSIVSAANFSQANAVRVTIAYSVPLAFAQIVGYAHKTAVEYSTAKVVTQTATPYVNATGDVWLAGEPAGTHGSQADPNYSATHPNSDHLYPYDIAGTPGEIANGASNYSQGQPYSSPIEVSFAVTPGSTITISNASGLSSYDHDTPVNITPNGNEGTTYVTGDAAAGGVSEHGISDVTMPIGAMNAVFLGSSVPDDNAAPAPLSFSTQAERDYAGLQPKVQQAFYVGDGQTSGGAQQQIVVPANATRLFLGVMDGWEWDNNLGGFNCTVTQTTITTVQ